MRSRVRFTDTDVRNAEITKGPNTTGLQINDIRGFLIYCGQREIVGCLGANPTGLKWTQVPDGTLPVILTVKPWFWVLGKPKFGNDVAVVARDERELVKVCSSLKSLVTGDEAERPAKPSGGDRSHAFRHGRNLRSRKPRRAKAVLRAKSGIGEEFGSHVGESALH